RVLKPWTSPTARTPDRKHGHVVADPRVVDVRFGFGQQYATNWRFEAKLADEEIGRLEPVRAPPGVTAIGFAARACRDPDRHNRERSSVAQESASIVRPAFASSNPSRIAS